MSCWKTKEHNSNKTERVLLTEFNFTLDSSPQNLSRSFSRSKRTLKGEFHVFFFFFSSEFQCMGLNNQISRYTNFNFVYIHTFSMKIFKDFHFFTIAKCFELIVVKIIKTWKLKNKVTFVPKFVPEFTLQIF